MNKPKEAIAAHLELSKLAMEVLPLYEMDDGSLSDEYLSFLKEDAKEFSPKGHLIKKISFF